MNKRFVILLALTPACLCILVASGCADGVPDSLVGYWTVVDGGSAGDNFLVGPDSVLVSASGSCGGMRSGFRSTLAGMGDSLPSLERGDECGHTVYGLHHTADLSLG